MVAELSFYFRSNHAKHYRMRYKCWKSNGEDRLLFVMVYEDAPDKDVPAPVWHMGPWQGHHEGEVRNLRPHYRQLLAEQRFVVIRPESLGAFDPEARQQSRREQKR